MSESEAREQREYLLEKFRDDELRAQEIAREMRDEAEDEDE